MTTMERACTRSVTAAANTDRMSAPVFAVPSSTSVSYVKKPVNPMSPTTCGRIVSTPKKLIAPRPTQQQFLIEPQPVRRKRRVKAKRISLADLNNDQQRNVISRSPNTNKENDEAAAVNGSSNNVTFSTPTKVKQPQQSRQLLITSFVKCRRSSRQPATTLKKQLEKEIQLKIINNVEEGLVKMWFGGKGWGVVAGREFERGEFVCEYSGELIPSLKSARERDNLYADLEPDVGCYMYDLPHLNPPCCIDATRDNGRFGRLINHSCRQANVKGHVMRIDSVPRLYFVTLRRIEKGEEFVYDYGERKPEVLEKFPWLKE